MSLGRGIAATTVFGLTADSDILLCLRMDRRSDEKASAARGPSRRCSTTARACDPPCLARLSWRRPAGLPGPKTDPISISSNNDQACRRFPRPLRDNAAVSRSIDCVAATPRR